MTIRLTDHQARLLRLNGQGLLANSQDPLPGGVAAAPAAARRVCGLQAQDMFAARLQVRVRSVGNVCIEDVERARYVERSVVWTWAMRGTLHLLAVDDLDWLLPLVGPLLVSGGARRRQQLGLSDETYARGLSAVCRRLSDGPATRSELGETLATVGITGGYSIERHALYRAAAEGIVCFGEDRGNEPTYVLLEEWLGRPLAPLPRPEALSRLVSRYLAGFGPATPADLAAWSGLPATLLRPAWDALAGELAEVEVSGKPAWLPKERLAELDALPPSAAVRLLPAFDTYLLGYRSRDLSVDPAFGDRINGGGGMIHATLLVDGRAAGTWQTNRKGRRVNISIDPFGDLPEDARPAITAEIADIERFLADDCRV